MVEALVLGVVFGRVHHYRQPAKILLGNCLRQRPPASETTFLTSNGETIRGTGGELLPSVANLGEEDVAFLLRPKGRRDLNLFSSGQGRVCLRIEPDDDSPLCKGWLKGNQAVLVTNDEVLLHLLRCRGITTLANRPYEVERRGDQLLYGNLNRLTV